ncbi:MAG: type II toxin-antitoxin system RelE/ParE family toxin, partial [Nitrospirota bacterium]
RVEKGRYDGGGAARSRILSDSNRRLTIAPSTTSKSHGIGRAFYCFMVGKRVTVLQAFIKKTQHTPDRELRMARKRLKELQKDRTKGSGIFFVTVRVENLCGPSDFLVAQCQPLPATIQDISISSPDADVRLAVWRSKPRADS